MLFKNQMLFFTTILLTSLCFAEEPIVLQNGTDSYTGCVDTYLATGNFYSALLNDNHSDSISLKTWT